MEALRKNSMNYGLALAVFLIVMTSIMYAVNLNLFTSSWLGILTIVIVTLFGIMATIKYKKTVCLLYTSRCV